MLLGKTADWHGYRLTLNVYALIASRFQCFSLKGAEKNKTAQHIFVYIQRKCFFIAKADQAFSERNDVFLFYEIM